MQYVYEEEEEVLTQTPSILLLKYCMGPVFKIGNYSVMQIGWIYRMQQDWFDVL